MKTLIKPYSLASRKMVRVMFPTLSPYHLIWNDSWYITEMTPYYRALASCTTLTIQPDPVLLEKMEKANEEELTKLDERLQEAEKTEGEMEISDALKARANYLTRIGDKV